VRACPSLACHPLPCTHFTATERCTPASTLAQKAGLSRQPPARLPACLPACLPKREGTSRRQIQFTYRRTFPRNFPEGGATQQYAAQEAGNPHTLATVQAQHRPTCRSLLGGAWHPLGRPPQPCPSYQLSAAVGKPPFQSSCMARCCSMGHCSSTHEHECAYTHSHTHMHARTSILRISDSAILARSAANSLAFVSRRS